MNNYDCPTFSVTFLPAERKITVPAGETILKAARSAGLHINASCGGGGVCGKCRVLIEQGAVTGGISDKIPPADRDSGYRQACSARISDNITVRIPVASSLGAGGLASAVPERHRARMHLYDIEELRRANIFMPPVEKLFLELPRPSAHENMADAGRIILGLSNQYNKKGIAINLAVLRKIRRAVRDDDFRVTVTLAKPVGNRGKTLLVNVQPGNWTKRNFGLAFDIGTTTVWGQLIDLTTGKVLAEAGDYNGQLSYGEDVISRIIYAEKPKGLELMQELVIATINSIITRLLADTSSPDNPEKKITEDEISSITLAGNTTMSHLLLGIEPNNIRRSPYVPVTTFFSPVRASDLNIKLPDFTVALVYPAISSYVGGDIVAGVMGSGMYRTDLLTLYIDIGTNAEIVIGNREWLVCAACSAGPAFEGGGITHGMRAASGAIEDFSLNPETLEPMLITIGNKPPIGICGSGLLIIVATLFENGLIEPSGKFSRRLNHPRIRAGRSGIEFILAFKEDAGGEQDIVINEVDIENFIRAKAAIFAGVKTLVEEVGLSLDDLEQVILAGAFGSYIDLDCAMTVGLLPEVNPEKILYVGNGSLMGARMSELSNHIRKDVVAVVHRMTSFELSEVNGFKDQFIASLFLPHTSQNLFPKVGARLATARTKRPLAG